MASESKFRTLADRNAQERLALRQRVEQLRREGKVATKKTAALRVRRFYRIIDGVKVPA